LQSKELKQLRFPFLPNGKASPFGYQIVSRNYASWLTAWKM